MLFYTFINYCVVTEINSRPWRLVLEILFGVVLFFSFYEAFKDKGQSAAFGLKCPPNRTTASGRPHINYSYFNIVEKKLVSFVRKMF